MFHKQTTAVLDRKTNRLVSYRSQNDAFRATNVNKSTGQRNLDSGRAVNDRYEFYSLNLQTSND